VHGSGHCAEQICLHGELPPRESLQRHHRGWGRQALDSTGLLRGANGSDSFGDSPLLHSAARAEERDAGAGRGSDSSGVVHEAGTSGGRTHH